VHHPAAAGAPQPKRACLGTRACGGACERARGAAQACAAGGARAAVAKAHAALVPAAARAAGDAVPDIREAALHALLAFAAKAGSLGALDKVPSRAAQQRGARSQALGRWRRSGGRDRRAHARSIWASWTTRGESAWRSCGRPGAPAAARRPST